MISFTDCPFCPPPPLITSHPSCQRRDRKILLNPPLALMWPEKHITPYHGPLAPACVSNLPQATLPLLHYSPHTVAFVFPFICEVWGFSTSCVFYLKQSSPRLSDSLKGASSLCRNLNTNINFSYGTSLTSQMHVLPTITSSILCYFIFFITAFITWNYLFVYAFIISFIPGMWYCKRRN